jgi:hypothetical protein
MSFRLFIYYCAVCGGWAALAGWAAGVVMTSGDGLWPSVVLGCLLGVAVAMALGTIDAVWNLTGHRYDRIVGRALFGGLLGGLSGMLGALVGYAIYSPWEGRLGDAAEFLKVPGWFLVGLLVGASIGLYDFIARMKAGDRSGGGVRKLLNGIVGGAIGGIIGGVLFVLLKLGIKGLLRAIGTETEPWSSSAAGLVALGACIGLFIGLAQVILKEAWITVESGRRAGRELILSKEMTTIGRAEACDVGLFGDNGIERLHARILLKNNRYLLADAGTPGGTYLNDRRIEQAMPLSSGDAIRVGGSVLRFGERQKRK